MCLLVALTLGPSINACQRQETGTNAAPVSRSDAAARARAPATQTFELDGVQVQVQFPGFRLLTEQSDPSAGLVAFAAEQPSADRTTSLFLDGSRSTTMPNSVAEALASVLNDDVCQHAGDCTELSHASLPGQGLLITVRRPHAVYSEVWRRNAQQRAVRCGAEMSELGASAPEGKRWLDDAAALRAAQAVCETLCRSVLPLP